MHTTGDIDKSRKQIHSFYCDRSVVISCTYCISLRFLLERKAARASDAGLHICRKFNSHPKSFRTPTVTTLHSLVLSAIRLKVKLAVWLVVYHEDSEETITSTANQDFYSSLL